MPPPGGWPKQIRLLLVGAAMHEWPIHALLDRLQVPADTVWQPIATNSPLLVVHLGPLEQPGHWQQLISLAQARWVITLSTDRAALFRALGIPALPVPHGLKTGPTWLHHPKLGQAAAGTLGLPVPAALASIGTILCLGHSSHPTWADAAKAGVLHLPNLAEIVQGSSQRARLLAAWLAACNRAGLQLVQLNPTAKERDLDAMRLLQPDALLFADPITPQEVVREWQWHLDGRPQPALAATPQPQCRQLWLRECGDSPTATVIISLYNYGDHIAAALDSVAAQSHRLLELILVDDDSSDDSAAIAMAWLELHHNRFSRSLLLQHTANAGLAATRNTAFHAAQAQWVYVLDADNTLHPQAVGHCLALAEASCAQTAVVHPVLRGISSLPNSDPQLLGHMPWNPSLLKRGNYIDAMALVRRSAWAEVAGYRHIPGGWEDFDFWCLLVEAGFHGVICPQPLAQYIQHERSMLQSQSNHQLRHLSRLMQSHHPWLELALAQPDR